ncbi:N-(5'-phosphoribosyl)anthranilate isomerase [Longibacter salinarum]|uniref:N-(5'-phosphoribosyl)anthranilate isomerase n=1 Tax=Longibacter salinarum TaxID=1850348 RepID=A0A2A8CWA7_9BACT|nr:phosphoribosylanthranilate isomerase [Longibacter salinarum]PEN12891.1 N-(5'-phosphoribosyl)anthranilate isomerase [Longibacter salinarum]
MRTKLKICGITDLADARYLAGEGVDYLGFVQHEDSPRYVVPSLVSDMLEWLYGPESVGVFVNKSADEVNAIADTAGFDYVQLHGEESPETCKAIERPIIKAIRVRHDASSDQLRAIMERYEDLVDHFLLDTHNSSVWGGTGESFNWRLARDLSNEYSLFLAGGIDDSNVERAVKTMRPYAIDLSSGVESAPGQKSFEKVDAFLETFRRVNKKMSDESNPSETDMAS